MPSVTVAFPLVDDPSTSLLAWTTTPWTLPSNLGVCVHPDFTYIKIHDIERDQNFILLESLLGTIYKGYDPKKKPDPKKGPSFTKVGSFLGKDMVGWKFVPIFDFFTEQVGFPSQRPMQSLPAQYEDRAFKVVADTYVTDTAGTGIVQQAPAFGEDDYRIAIRFGIVSEGELPPCPLDESGRFTSQVPPYEGQYLKDADAQIIKDVQKKGRLIARSELRHSYPFCYR